MTNPTNQFAAGARVSTATPVNGAYLRGTVQGVDADHYHARVNGRIVYRVRWDNGTGGSGWTHSELVGI